MKLTAKATEIVGGLGDYAFPSGYGCLFSGMELLVVGRVSDISTNSLNCSTNIKGGGMKDCEPKFKGILATPPRQSYPPPGIRG